MDTKGSRENVVDVANGEGGGAVDFFDSLPEGFIADTLSMTSPRDVCRMSVVASIFRSAAEWNAVWEKFLPVDYEDIIGQAVLDGDRLNQLRSYTKKELYLHLCDNPILIDGGIKSFSLEKNSGKKCYMLGARNLWIVWGSTPQYWSWTSLPESRFPEVGELIGVCWLEMRGTIDTSILSLNTAYAAYLVFKIKDRAYGFENQAVEVSIGAGRWDVSKNRAVYLVPESGQNQRHPRRRRGLVDRGAARVDGVHPKERVDGWLEIEIGEFFNKDGDNGELDMSITEIKGGHWKRGLIIEGIEIRPKSGKN